MATLVLGPMLRYVSDTAATIWVETDAAMRRRGRLGATRRCFHLPDAGLSTERPSAPAADDLRAPAATTASRLLSEGEAVRLRRTALGVVRGRLRSSAGGAETTEPVSDALAVASTTPRADEARPVETTEPVSDALAVPAGWKPLDVGPR